MWLLDKLPVILIASIIVLAEDLIIAERIPGFEGADIAERQISDIFTTIGVVCAGCPITTPTPISVVSSSSTSSSTTSTSKRFSVAPQTTTSSISSSSSPPAPTIATGPYDPRALTTTFTQPSTCTDYSGGYSVIDEWGDGMWYNAIYSKLTMSSYSSCYPPQFYSSILATSSGLPFTSLICPYSWEPYNLNASYVVCCPPPLPLQRDFLVTLPELDTNPQRPGNGAFCWSALGFQELIDVTSFDSTGGSTFVPVTVGSMTSNVAMAYAFDGIMATPLTNFTPLPTPRPTDGGLVTSTSSGGEAVQTNSAATGVVGGNTAAVTSSSAVRTAVTTSLKTSSASRATLCFPGSRYKGGLEVYSRVAVDLNDLLF
ncbi:hypothetical protein IFR05_012557 [Cadophora sp. M221]|nr:hypothetical protein IFR05_012557 [Cadophora sp. M221]